MNIHYDIMQIASRVPVLSPLDPFSVSSRPMAIAMLINTTMEVIVMAMTTTATTTKATTTIYPLSESVRTKRGTKLLRNG